MKSSATRQLEVIMALGEPVQIGVPSMNEGQRQALLEWGERLYALGRARIGWVDAVKYEGRLVVLNDDSRWEVGEGDYAAASRLKGGEKVLIIDGQMHLLDDWGPIEIQEER